MKSSVLWVGLLGCWGSSPPKPAEEPKPTVAPRPEDPEDAAHVAKQTGKPVVKKPPYVMPGGVADALAAEKLAGNVLVAADATLYASAATARKDVGPSRGRATAMSVLADHNDVVEVATKFTADCVRSWEQPYELRVFVARDKLTARAKADIVKTFADGTAVAIDRGAPVDTSEKGLAWETMGLDETGLKPSDDQLVLSVPPITQPSALPPASGDRLVCDGTPMTHSDWKAAKQREREAESRAREERRKAEYERRLAIWEAGREERERKRKAEQARRAKRAEEAAKKLPPKTGKHPIERQETRVAIEKLLVDIDPRPSLYDDFGFDDDKYDAFGGLSRYDDQRFVKWCGASDPSRDTFDKPAVKVAPPTVDGKPVAWPSSYWSSGSNDSVSRKGTKYYADVDYTCGRVRMQVPEQGVQWTGAGGVGSMGGGSQQVKVWVPSPGPVTWPDGSPAGTYTGHKKYRTFVEETDRICVNVPDVAEKVCHPKKTAKTEMAYPWGLD